MDFKIIYEDEDILVVEKPAGIVVFPEGQTTKNTMIQSLLEKYPDLNRAGEEPRYGVVHRLDKDTSGILLAAKNNEALKFLQNQFINRKVEKKYIALATGAFKNDEGIIEALMGRSPADPRKQKAYRKDEKAPKGARQAVTEYKVLSRSQSNRESGQKFQDYALLEVKIKTGRKHQIRCHLAHIHHPLAGDKVYGFKDSPILDGLNRQFLHASYLKIQLPRGEIKEFNSELPEELKKVLKNLK